MNERISLRWGRVRAVVDERPGLQRLRLRAGRGVETAALCLTDLCGRARPGDRVLLNTTAAELGLGSGGFHLVVGVAGRMPRRRAEGHLVKLRYTPGQLAVRSCGEFGTPGRGRLRHAAGLGGMPVVAGSLHAQVAPAAVACRLRGPGLRIAYVMTDGGALPAALLDDVAALRARGVLDAVITCGHAFGGDLEALGIPAGLMAARHGLGCDVAIAAMGPGVAGTGTRWDNTALELAEIVDVAAALGGRPVAMARVSFADARGRHRGLSHHSRTALALARAPALVPAPPGDLAHWLRRLPAVRRHAVVGAGDGRLFAAVRAELPEHRSMGRGWAEEGALFRIAAAAGAVAAQLAGGPPDPGGRRPPRAGPPRLGRP